MGLSIPAGVAFRPGRASVQ